MNVESLAMNYFYLLPFGIYTIKCILLELFHKCNKIILEIDLACILYTLPV